MNAKLTTNWIGHILNRNCLLKCVVEEKIERRVEVIEDEEEVVSGYWILETKRGSTSSHCMENLLWQTSWTLSLADCRKNQSYAVHKDYHVRGNFP